MLRSNVSSKRASVTLQSSWNMLCGNVFVVVCGISLVRRAVPAYPALVPACRTRWYHKSRISTGHWWSKAFVSCRAITSGFSVFIVSTNHFLTMLLIPFTFRESIFMCFLPVFLVKLVGVWVFWYSKFWGSLYNNRCSALLFLKGICILKVICFFCIFVICFRFSSGEVTYFFLLPLLSFSCW